MQIFLIEKWIQKNILILDSGNGSQVYKKAHNAETQRDRKDTRTQRFL